MPHARNRFALALATFLFAAFPLALIAADDPPAVLPASVTILTRADFANRHWFSVADVLDHTPSIDVRRVAARGTAATARLRGLGSAGSLVIAIDGRPITNEYDGDVDLSQIPLNILERIEITRGGSNVLYGPATAGIVNLVTTRPAQKGLVADLGTGIGRDGVRTSNGRFVGRGRVGDAVYIGGLENSGGYTRNDETDFTSHFGNFTRSFKKGGFWGAQYLYAKGDAGTPDGTALPLEQWNHHDEEFPLNANGREESNHQMIRLHAASPRIASGTVHLEITQSFRNEKIFDGLTNVQDQDNKSSDVRLRYSRKGLEVGGEAAAMERRLFDATTRQEGRTAGFVTQNIQAGRWTFVPGLRWDDHSRAGAAPTYRAALLYQPGTHWTTSVTGQTAPRFANLVEIFPSTGPERSINPEKSDSYDAGVAWQAKEFRVAATGFSSRTRDVIAPAATGEPANGAHERARGVEFEGAGRIGRGNWSELHLRANYTYQEVERRDIGSDVYLRSPFAPTQTAWVSADLRLPWKLSITNEVRYEGAQYSGTGKTGGKLQPFALWNTRLNVRIHTADLYFAIDNARRRRYAEAFGPSGALEPQPDRTYWIGLTIRFTN